MTYQIYPGYWILLFWADCHGAYSCIIVYTHRLHHTCMQLATEKDSIINYTYNIFFIVHTNASRSLLVFNILFMDFAGLRTFTEHRRSLDDVWRSHCVYRILRRKVLNAFRFIYSSYSNFLNEHLIHEWPYNIRCILKCLGYLSRLFKWPNIVMRKHSFFLRLLYFSLR